MIKKTLGIEKGSGVPHRNKVGKLTKSQVQQIAKDKMADLNTSKEESAEKIVAGVARSMGVEISD